MATNSRSKTTGRAGFTISEGVHGGALSESRAVRLAHAGTIEKGETTGNSDVTIVQAAEDRTVTKQAEWIQVYNSDLLTAAGHVVELAMMIDNAEPDSAAPFRLVFWRERVPPGACMTPWIHPLHLDTVYRSIVMKVDSIPASAIQWTAATRLDS